MRQRSAVKLNLPACTVISILLAGVLPAAGLDASRFQAGFSAGMVTSLADSQDGNRTEFIAPGQRLGDVLVKYRQDDSDWETAATTSPAAETTSSNAAGTEFIGTRSFTNGSQTVLEITTRFQVQPDALLWNVTVQNESDRPLEVGDLALPLPMSRTSGRNGKPLLKHSFISGHGSFLFWMRADSVAPFLTMIPTGDTHLEYWDASRDTGYRVYIHSAAAGAVAAQHGTKWRQPNTSVTLAPKGRSGDTQTYGFKFRFADNYDGVRQILVDEGGIDVQVVPGMTVPTDLFAEFALRTKQAVRSVDAEFPGKTTIVSLGAKGDTSLYRVHFSKLGENELTVRYGNNRHMFLEFFSTEPLETLIKKRGAFLARSQHRDPDKWYNGLITDWNMEQQKLISPDDYAPIPRSRVYAVTCDDPGLGKPAFLAAKNAEYPVQGEVDALDYYIAHFVWGGLQRTTAETYSYAIYGIPNWKTNRDSADPGRNGRLHFWREYDYPHIVQMYFAMYRLAKNHPEIKTALTAREYLQRAWGTANAFFTIPHEVYEGWSPYGTGFYNEIVIVDLIRELRNAGMNDEASTLQKFWERKVKNFVNEDQDLFRSEYAFDSTGFESTGAIAKYALQHADPPGVTNSGIPLANARRFMNTQIAANLFCRGWLEPAYYYLGSDYRGGGGNAYVLTYMSQMGGWSVLDYALNFATNRAPYLRLGYASYLSAWALMNTGTPESDYGYWYPGQANDGGAGGGFEPAPYGRTWLGQPHHRGSWYFSSEIDLGYCGALRTAATILEDDPVFGRFCFGGDWDRTADGVEVIPKDGLRRRFHALLDEGALHLVLDNDRFAKAQPISLSRDLSEIRFQVESDNHSAHTAMLAFSGPSQAAEYVVSGEQGPLATISFAPGQETQVALPMAASIRPQTFSIVRKK